MALNCHKGEQKYSVLNFYYNFLIDWPLPNSQLLIINCQLIIIFAVRLNNLKLTTLW